MSDHSPIPPIDFFQKTQQNFALAANSTANIIGRYYRIGDATICLLFAGPALISKITPAFAHLATTSTSRPDLTICLWDAASTDTKMELPPWTERDYLEFGLIKWFNTERIKTLHHHALHTIDLEQNIALYWIENAAHVPWHHGVTPLRTLLHWWFTGRKKFIIHAAAIGSSNSASDSPDNGVLVTGSGGAGKSTTALSAVTNGLGYASDENCLITLDPKPRAYSLFSSGTLEAADVGRIPALYSSLVNRSHLGQQKAVYQLHPQYQQLLRSELLIKAVFVPQVTGLNETTIRRMSPAKALLALAPGSIFQLPGSGRASLQAMAQLLRKTPCYTLFVGTNLANISQTIDRFLQDRGSVHDPAPQP